LLAGKLDNKLLIVMDGEVPADGDRAESPQIATKRDRARTSSYLGLALLRQ
jgi:hypothetical protein